MAGLRPIHYKQFEKFLLFVGCRFVRQTGDHKVYERNDLKRPVIVRTKKDLPVIEIKSNLRTLGMTNQEYLEILKQI